MLSVAFAVLLFIVGLYALLKGADWLVAGASAIAQTFKISPIVIGLTVVAFGTSAPELIVSVTSAISGNTDVALGNIIGSNIANILLILGASSLFHPLTVAKNTVWKEIPMSFLAAIVLAILGLQSIIDNNTWHLVQLQNRAAVGSISASNGLILLCFFGIFIYYTFGIAKVSSDDEPEIEKMTNARALGFLIVGLASLALGSRLIVDNGTTLARSLGVSDALIGLTLVAIGTSLPELITSVVAAMKKKVDIAVGNVIGSNIFNIFFVLGLTPLFREIPLPGIVVMDILVLFLTTIILFVLLFLRKRHTIARGEGVIMLCLYVAYVTFLIIRG